MESRTATTFKCLLLGAARAGKTAFVAANLGRDVPAEYNASLGITITPLSFKTTTDTFVHFNVWDIPGYLQPTSADNEYCIGAHCAIIVYDASDPKACVPVSSEWRTKLGIPIIIMGTHRDMYTISDIDSIKCAMKPAIHVSSTNKDYIETPFDEFARTLAHVELLTRQTKIPTTRSERVALNIQELLRRYEYVPFISAAFAELRKESARLFELSGLITMGKGSAAQLACSPSILIDEFAATYGITMTYDGNGDDAKGVLWYILNQIANSTYPTPHITQKFIDTMDRELFDFITARISVIHGVFRGAETIYRNTIEDIAKKVRVTTA